MPLTALPCYRSRRALLGGFAAALLLPPSARAKAAGMANSPWQPHMGTRLRLSGAPSGAAGHYLAAIEIALEPGYKTYWRNPGDSGVPPTFDFGGSQNLAAAEVLFPAPTVFDDGAGGLSIGYTTSIGLPVLVRAREPAQPVRLAVQAQLGVCERFCVPIQAELLLTLAPALPPLAETARAALLASVPRPQAVAHAGAVAILAHAPVAGEGKALTLEARWPAGEEALLLVEAEGGWFFEPVRQRAGAGGAQRVAIPIAQRASRRDAASNRARVTLLTATEAIESVIALDGGTLPH
jgi:DsbC/DsbD-like thiol-disulfide interchange protein